MSSSSIRVLIVSDLRLLREGVARVLRGASGFSVFVTTSRFASQSMARTSRSLDVVLVDVGVAGIVSTVRDIALSHSRTPIIGIGSLDDHLPVPLARAGLTALLALESSPNALRVAIRSAVGGKRGPRPFPEASPTRASHPMTVAELRPLTPRETEILLLIERGLSNKAIATHLAISVSTVKNHVHNVLAKLDAGSRGEAASIARWLRSAGPIPAFSHQRLATR